MNKKQKSSIIIASLAAVAIAGSLIAGSTYALFTSESKTNIAVSSGKVNVTANINNMLTYTGKDLTGVVGDDEAKIKKSIEYGLLNGQFMNGGTAEIDGTSSDLVLTKVTPGDKVTFTINLKNNSNVAVKYRTIISCKDDDGLFNGLEFTVGEDTFSGRTSTSVWKTLTINDSSDIASLACTVNLPSDAGNVYQDKSCKVTYTVEAVQGNAATTDPDDNLIEVYTVSDLKWVQKHNSEIDATKTVKLMNNLDLSGENWTPIGNATSVPFVATFDGNDKTISNLASTKYSYQRQENCAYGTGLFSYVSNATIKNVVIESANVGGETAYDGAAMYSEVGIVAGCTYGNSTFDKITIKNSSVKAQTKVGAIVGQSATAGSTTKITNCTITNVTVSGNYSYAIVCGLINNSASSVDWTGTTVTSSTASFWTSDLCDFKNTESCSIYSETWGTDTYKWELYGSSFFITEVVNAWAVQRGSNPTVTSNTGVADKSGSLLETTIHVDNELTRTFPRRWD